MMKFLAITLLVLSMGAWAQDPTTYLGNFDSKIYSLKTKGVKEFVVDIESPKLTAHVNEQMIFGKVNELIFRTYWTANPERVAIEVVGLPEGFREIKEELKMSIFAILENLLPIPTAKKFNGYKITAGPNAKEFTVQDTTGIASIPGYILKFDQQDRLTEVTGKKTVGTLSIIPKYEKESFADGKWVLKSQVTQNAESGQLSISRKELTYGTSQGIGILAKLKLITEQRPENGNAKPLILEESIEFKNYKINAGEALKYFLVESPKK